MRRGLSGARGRAASAFRAAFSFAVAGASAACAGDGPGGEGAAAPPPDMPGLFGFGRPASGERVAMWDVDVKPNGEGLPPGAGSVEEGRRVYETHCAACHGPSGTEGPNDRLVSRGAWDQWPADRSVGSYWPYATTLFDYTRKAMPQNAPGSLSDDQVYAVVAYVLSLNGLVESGAVMDSAALASVRMPARDRFVPDDRTGGARIR